MYNARIENYNGEVLLLTNDEASYQIIGIQGLNPPKAQINTTSIVGLDGSMFNSSKLDTRNIVITIRLNGDVEGNRIKLYDYFVVKEKCVFYYTNGRRNVKIEGYVDNVECDLFTDNEIAQISIICPDPYFKSVSEIVADISNTLALFTFPFSINLNEEIAFSLYEESRTANVYNNSDGSTGAVIEALCINGISSIRIQNTRTGEFFKLDYNFQADDLIIINTNKGNKSAVLRRGTAELNLFSTIVQGSTFFQLGAGNNQFSCITTGGLSDTENVKVKFIFKNSYRGV